METQSTTSTQGLTLKTVIRQGIRNFILGLIALWALFFLLAGTLNYWQAWVFSLVFNTGLITQGIYLYVLDPELLERRTKVATAAESRGQRLIIIIGLLSLVCVLILSPLDHRFGWSQMTAPVSWLGEGLIVLSFVLYYFVFRENSFAAASIQTFENQRVISSGPYALVRHPKYVGDLLLVIGIPLALGSWWGLLFLPLTVVGLVWRILDEEHLLKQDLPGYTGYMQQVRYRLVPYLW